MAVALTNGSTLSGVGHHHEAFIMIFNYTTTLPSPHKHCTSYNFFEHFLRLCSWSCVLFFCVFFFMSRVTDEVVLSGWRFMGNWWLRQGPFSLATFFCSFSSMGGRIRIGHTMIGKRDRGCLYEAMTFSFSNPLFLFPAESDSKAYGYIYKLAVYPEFLLLYFFFFFFFFLAVDVIL